MLLLPLLLPLATASGTAGEELSGRLPEDAQGVMLVHEPQRLWSSDEVSGFAAFLQDPRWAGLLSALDEADGELEQALKFWRHFESVRGAAVGTWEFQDDGSMSGLGILQADGSLLEDLREDGPSLGLSFEQLELPGWEGTAWAMDPGEEADPILVAEHAGLVYFGWPGVEEPVAHLMRAARPETGASRWWLEVEEREAGAQVEFFIRSSEEVEGSADLSWAEEFGPFYVAATLAPDARLATHLKVNAPDYLPKLAECLLPADSELYGLAGPEHLSVSVLAVDVLKAAEFGLQIAEQQTENAGAEYEGAMMAAGAFLGLEMEEDVLSKLTGQFLMFQRPTDLEEVMAEELTQDSIPTFAFGHRDRDAFLLVIESLVGTLANFALPVEFEEHAEGELWTTSLDAMVPGLGEIGVAVDDRFVVLGPASDVRGILERSAGTYQGPSFARGALEGDKELGSGFIISATDMTASWDMLDGFSEVIPLLAEVEDIEEVVAFTSEMLAIARDHLGGVWLMDVRVGSQSVELDLFGF